MDLEEHKKQFRLDYEQTADLRKQMAEDKRFYLGDQWSKEDKEKLEAEFRPAAVYDEIGPSIDLIAAIYRENKLDISYVPVDDFADFQVAITLTRIAKNVLYRNNFEFTENDTFDDQLIKGAAGWICYIDKVTDDIIIDRERPERIIWDRDSEIYDRSDAQRVSRWKWMSLNQIKSEYHGVKGIEELVFPGKDEWETMIREEDDKKFDIHSEPSDYPSPDKKKEYLYLDFERKRLRVIESWYYNYEKEVWLRDLDTKETQPTKFKSIKEAQEQIAYMGYEEVPESLSFFERYVKKVKKLTYCLDKILQDDYWTYTSILPVVPVYGVFYDGEILSMVTKAKDPQRDKNKRRIQGIDILNKLPSAGFVHVKGHVENIDEIRKHGFKPGFDVELSEDSIIGTHFQIIEPPKWPTGLARYEETAKQEIRENTGANVDLRGLKEGGAEPGYAIHLRQRAGTMQSSRYANNIRRSKMILGNLILEMIQNVWTYNKIIRLIGSGQPEETVSINQPAQAVDQMGNPMVDQMGYPITQILNNTTIGKYDVRVSEAKSAPTLRILEFEQMMAMRKEGIPILPERIIEKSDLSNKDDLLADLKKLEMQAQQMQAQGQIPPELQGGQK